MRANAKSIENTEPLAAAKIGAIASFRNFCYRLVKRSFDIVFALVGCVGVIILIPFVKISYLLTGDRNPIFLKNHMRIGRGG